MLFDTNRTPLEIAYLSMVGRMKERVIELAGSCNPVVYALDTAASCSKYMSREELMNALLESADMTRTH